MKRVLRIITIALMVTICATCIAMATTGGVYAATKTTIVGTSAKADSRVVSAFEDLGFQTRIDSSVGYAGVFSVAKHEIVVKKNNNTYVLHEMGHFLSRLKGGADSTSKFATIYKSEKNKYSGMNKTYITSNSKEYFAQSFAEYTQNGSELKASRPNTYSYIEKTVNSVSSTDVNSMYKAYGWAW